MEQEPNEFAKLLHRIQGVKSILEIGCREGYSMLGMAKVAAPGARLVAIDWGKIPPYAGISLTHMIDVLRRVWRFDAHVLLCDSHEEMALNFAKDLGPYDFVFIDGDHTYAGVEQDWTWYGPLGKLVGFHDIRSWSTGVPRLWQEIQAAGNETEELIVREGIGLVIK